jgi:hypothetical protein
MNRQPNLLHREKKDEERFMEGAVREQKDVGLEATWPF